MASAATWLLAILVLGIFGTLLVLAAKEHDDV